MKSAGSRRSPSSRARRARKPFAVVARHGVDAVGQGEPRRFAPGLGRRAARRRGRRCGRRLPACGRRAPGGEVRREAEQGRPRASGEQQPVGADDEELAGGGAPGGRDLSAESTTVLPGRRWRLRPRRRPRREDRTSSRGSAPASSSRSRGRRRPAASRPTPRQPKPVPRISLREVSLPSDEPDPAVLDRVAGQQPRPSPAARPRSAARRRAWVALLCRGLMRWLNSRGARWPARAARRGWCGGRGCRGS